MLAKKTLDDVSASDFNVTSATGASDTIASLGGSTVVAKSSVVLQAENKLANVNMNNAVFITSGFDLLSIIK